MPCCVDLERFQFRQEDRQSIRSKLGLTDQEVVGIYTGKLGGIYLDDEAIEIIKLSREQVGSERFYLIILSPDFEAWSKKLLEAGFNERRFHIGFVDQSEVGSYLSASDFAYSLHRPTPSKMGISPIKNGEYMANGLPVIIPNGIGDDSDLIASNNFGVVVPDLDRIYETNFRQLDDMIGADRKNGRIATWAKSNRSFDLVRDCYSDMLAQLK